jgi:hypothetical protein
MKTDQPVPYMRFTSDTSSLAPRVKRGMTIEQVREIWIVRAEAKTKEIMGKYAKRKLSGGGREGLGIYGQFQSRTAREKVRLAEKLLKSAGLQTDDATIRKVMRR